MVAFGILLSGPHVLQFVVTARSRARSRAWARMRLTAKERHHQTHRVAERRVVVGTSVNGLPATFHVDQESSGVTLCVQAQMCAIVQLKDQLIGSHVKLILVANG